MKNVYLMILISILTISCQNTSIDTAPMSGTINQSDEKTAVVVKLAKAYEAGAFEAAKDYFTPDGKHYFNNIEFSTDEIIDGYNFHTVLYDDLQHLNADVTTMYYNNGDVYTNQWSDWTGKSKITGKVHTNTFHCWWKWEGDKIVSTQCYIDPTDLMEETALYQAKMAEEN